MRDRRAGRRRLGGAVGGATLLLALTACSGQPTALPTIGSPEPVAAVSPTAEVGRAADLARKWHLTGAALPQDWPDVPLPKGTEVVTAYAIGAQPRRTWTATFATDTGTALELVQPVVAAMRERGYVPIAEYVGDAATNTGLFSFAAPTYAVYLVLGEDDGRPNVVLTVRGTTDANAGLPSTTPGPSASASSTPSSTRSPSASEAPADQPPTSPIPDGSAAAHLDPSPTASPTWPGLVTAA